MKKNHLLKTILFSGTIFLLSSCALDVESGSNNPAAAIYTKQKEKTPLIRSFYATGQNNSVSLQWAPISSEYDVFVTQKKIRLESTYNAETKNYDVTKAVDQQDEPVKITAENVNSNGTPGIVFSGLININEEEKLNETKFYSYTLSVYKGEKLVEEQTAEATPAGNFTFADEIQTTGVWTRLLSPDSFIPQEANTTGVTKILHTSDAQFQIAKFVHNGKNSTLTNIYNNPSAVTELVRASGWMETDNYKSYLAYLEPGEELQWFSVYHVGYHIELYGKIVNTSFIQNGYNEATDISVLTAAGTENSIEALTDAFRVGTIVSTKGFYQENDGGASFYTISTRPAYTYGSVRTAAGQYANIVLKSGSMNLIQLGAGKCFQVTSAKAKDWHNYIVAKRAYDKAVKAGNSSCDEWDGFVSTHPNWKAYTMNDDGDRIVEANKILKAYRTKKNEKTGKTEEDLSIALNLYVPAGQYRIATAVNASIQNYSIRGDTNCRHPEPYQLESFEQTFALEDESGSSNFYGTVLYTDNGSGCNHLNIYGPANNTLVEGLTFESRETDSKRTYWYTSKDDDGTKHGINFIGDGSLEKTMADEQWYSRQVMISQCQNVTVRNCEFIITSHIRDQAKYPANWTEHKEDLYDFDFDGPEFLGEGDAHGNLWKSGTLPYYGYQANPYVEWCDLHTDKQFTNVTLYSGWSNVKVDNCLMYNMSGVFRGANLGYLDFYGEQCYNGSVTNCTLYHNCHDEQIGIFTLTSDARNFNPNECIKGAKFSNNKVYTYNDEHVSNIKNRVMVFTVGYNGSKNITGVEISNNYFLFEDLPSKGFTFGGCPDDGRDTTLVTNNTFDIVNSGGSYIFETVRSYVKINNNTFNYKVNPEKGYIGGILVDARFPNDYTQYEMEFCSNKINCDGTLNSALFTTLGNKSNGKVNNNVIKVQGDIGTPFTGPAQLKNNSLNIKGRLTGFYKSAGELTKNTVIDGNKIRTLFNDYDDDYNVLQADGGYHETGRQGFTLFDIGCNTKNDAYKIIISNNIVSAPNCTRMNKHFMRYSTNAGTQDGVTIRAYPRLSIYNNIIQKYWYMRGMTEEHSPYVAFLNNYNNYKNVEKISSWYFPSALADTENGLYVYIPKTLTYKLARNYGVYKIPKYYDDGSNGKHSISVIGEEVYKDKKWISVSSEFPDSIVEIEREAFCNSSAYFNSLPAKLKTIRKKAFYDCNKIGENDGNAHYAITNQLDKKIVIPKSVQTIESKAFRITDRRLTIYCEAESKPAGWAEDWYEQYNLNGIDTIEVVWGYKKE